MSERNTSVRRIRRFLTPGLISVLVLTVLLLLTAALANDLSAILRAPSLSGKLCLTLAAVLCGLLRAKGSESGKLLAAFSGEGVLLAALLIACVVSGEPIFSASMLVDLLCLAFGGFAGTLLASREGRRKRRRK